MCSHIIALIAIVREIKAISEAEMCSNTEALAFTISRRSCHGDDGWSE